MHPSGSENPNTPLVVLDGDDGIDEGGVSGDVVVMVVRLDGGDNEVVMMLMMLMMASVGWSCGDDDGLDGSLEG
ncbi:hypothetical protein Tco_1580249 [Tanacetum coccineum]